MSTLCEKCKISPATVRMEQNVNGIVTKFHYCQSCAALSTSKEAFDEIVKNFISSLVGFEDEIALVEIDISEENIDEKENINAEPLASTKCKTCGLTLEGFRKATKLGCGDCYTVFRPELVKILTGIHDFSVHSGKIPIKGGTILIKLRKIENLRADLANAVEHENYEEAAKLRDTIKRFVSEESETIKNTMGDGLNE